MRYEFKIDPDLLDEDEFLLRAGELEFVMKCSGKYENIGEGLFDSIDDSIDWDKRNEQKRLNQLEQAKFKRADILSNQPDKLIKLNRKNKR